VTPIEVRGYGEWKISRDLYAGDRGLFEGAILAFARKDCWKQLNRLGSPVILGCITAGWDFPAVVSQSAFTATGVDRICY
jgi:hypothetical protein